MLNDGEALEIANDDDTEATILILLGFHEVFFEQQPCWTDA